MPGFTDLPSEILQEIVSLVLVIEQSTTSKSDINNQSKYEDRHCDEAIWERADFLEAYSLSKIITHSFTKGIAEINDYKASDMNLQYEFFADVYRQRVQRGDLLSLALSCQTLRAIVEPILYRTVELKSDTKGDSSPVTIFLHSIFKQPSLGGHVRKLSFRSKIDTVELCYKQSKDGQLGNLQNAMNQLEHFAISRPSEKELETWHPDVQQALLFYFLPNLHAVRVTLERVFPSIWDEFVALWFSTLEPIPLPSALQNLHELSIIFDGTDIDGVYSIYGILPALLLPNLYTLYIGNGLGTSSTLSWDILFPDDLRPYRIKLNIKK